MSVVNGSGMRDRPAPKNGVGWMIAHGWRRDLKDVGDQALMRGLATAFPIMRPGCPDLTAGVGVKPATKRLTGVPLPWSRPRPCARGRFRCFQVVWASLATDHMKPTSSRAIAVQTTVVFFPRPLSAR